LTNTQAWATYDAFIRDNRIVLATDEPPNLDKRWREFAERSTASPKLWMDAYLAAFALAAGHRFVTTDRAFRQFRELDLLVLEETPSS
jgi:predicted nucleic acid-binding protein